jgi:hypothetical protein
MNDNQMPVVIFAIKDKMEEIYSELSLFIQVGFLLLHSTISYRTLASAGEGKGGSCPPGRLKPAKNSMFLDFFGKNSIFFVVF